MCCECSYLLCNEIMLGFVCLPTSSISCFHVVEQIVFRCMPLMYFWYFFPIDFRHPFALHLGGIRSFSDDISHFPAIEDPQIKRAFKDLMATNWDDLPSAVIHDAKKALSKSTEDKSAQDALKDVFRAAEAVEEFTGIVMSLKMELDDAIGLSGEVMKIVMKQCF